jgi:peptidoglycan/LPS O-acetylase OafA/YrhL
MGVFLFFLISGFVILMTLEKSISFLSFIKKRYLRLLPAMLVSVIFIYLYKYLLLDISFSLQDIINLMSPVSLIHPIFFEKIFSLNIFPVEGVLWTLYLEFLFYVIFGGLFFLLGKRRALIGLFFISLFTFTLKIFSYFDISSNKPLMQTFNFSHSVGLEYLSWFFAGAIGYLYFCNRNRNNLFLLIVASTFTAVSYGHFVAVFFISLFCLSILVKDLQDILSKKFFIFFGFISYPFYLTHNEFGVFLISKISYSIPSAFMVMAPILPLSISISLSYIVSKFLEPKVRVLLTKLLR